MEAIIYSLIVPVYRNQEFIPLLLSTCRDINESLSSRLEVVFVVDGSPDDSYKLLADSLPTQDFASQLILHSRNFGSFAAIRSGLLQARGNFFSTMSADLQEPPELITTFFEALETGEVDLVVGTRTNREDGAFSRLFSQTHWWLYKKLVIPDMPDGGVDMFGCNEQFRQELLQLKESHSSLVGLIYWLGFRRREIPYQRQPRIYGKSAWTLGKKIEYFSNSVFAFSDLPIRVLISVGALGLLVSVIFGSVVLAIRIFAGIEIPGYSATMLTILFFGALNSLGLGIVGAYVWRAYGNVQARPDAIVMKRLEFPASDDAPDVKG